MVEGYDPNQVHEIAEFISADRKKKIDGDDLLAMQIAALESYLPGMTTEEIQKGLIKYKETQLSRTAITEVTNIQKTADLRVWLNKEISFKYRGYMENFSEYEVHTDSIVEIVNKTLDSNIYFMGDPHDHGNFKRTYGTKNCDDQDIMNQHGLNITFEDKDSSRGKLEDRLSKIIPISGALLTFGSWWMLPFIGLSAYALNMDGSYFEKEISMRIRCNKYPSDDKLIQLKRNLEQYRI